MEKTGEILLSDITFKTTIYHKNYDIVIKNDNIVSEYTGEISEVRYRMDKPPFIAGEFGISVCNIELAKILDIDFMEVLSEHTNEDIYYELIAETNFNIENFKKIVLVSHFILHPDYRKHNLFQEFTEYLYRHFYADGVAIIVLAKPIQDNEIDFEYYLHEKSVEQVLNRYHDIEYVPARIYYSLDDLLTKNDRETNEYKLFAVVARCGFVRINDTHLFKFIPDVILAQMQEKRLK